MIVSRNTGSTFVSKSGLDGDDVAMLRLVGNCCCRIIIFFSHVVPDLRLCRNASARKTWRIYDLVVITTKGRRVERERAARHCKFKMKARSAQSYSPVKSVLSKTGQGYYISLFIKYFIYNI